MEDECDQLLADGMALLADKAVSEAVSKFEDALTLAQTGASDEVKGDCCYLLAGAYGIEGRHQDALRVFTQARDFYSTLPDSRKLQMSLAMLGRIYASQENLVEADTFFKQAHEHASSTPVADQIDQVDNLMYLGAIAGKQKDWAKSEQYARQLLQYQERKLGPDARNLVPILEVIAEMACRQRNESDEKSFRDRAIALREKLIRQQVSAETIEKMGLPNGWGSDKLTNFFDTRRQNLVATFVRNSAQFDRLKTLDAKFRDLQNPIMHFLKPSIQQKNKELGDFGKIQLDAEEWLEVYFYMTSHSSYLGAADAAMGAQLPEACMMMRGCLEGAMYAYFVLKEPQVKTVWLSRHLNPAARSACKTQFSPGKIFKLIRQENRILADAAEALYDRAIDNGAHPNVRAFTQNSMQINENGEIRFASTFLNPAEIHTCLDQLIETTETVLAIYNVIFPG